MYSKKEKTTALCLSLLAMTAITAIAVHALGWLDLYYSARWIVLPAFVLIFGYAAHHAEMGEKIFKGWVYGVIAVTIYDLSRIPFMLMGWGDFIPTIGDWIMGSEEVSPLVGYAWRYIGNGGGLGIAFVLMMHYFKIQGPKIQQGLLYGLAVWACLTSVLLISPHARELMFSLYPLSVIGSIVGHVVYGLVLGYCVHRDPKIVRVVEMQGWGS